MNEETFITVALTEAQAFLIADALDQFAALSDCDRDDDDPVIAHGDILCGFAANFYNAMDEPEHAPGFNPHRAVTIGTACLHD